MLRKECEQDILDCVPSLRWIDSRRDKYIFVHVHLDGSKILLFGQYWDHDINANDCLVAMVDSGDKSYQYPRDVYYRDADKEEARRMFDAMRQALR